MKFNLHGHSSPDWKRPPPPEFVPSPVRSGSARITFQLHAHTYTSSVKLHYNTTKTQTTTTTITIHITTFGMFREGEGGGSSHKYQSLWSFTQKIMEYQWVCCHLSSTLPLPHPPDSCSFNSRLLRLRGRPELGAGGATSSSSSLELAAYSCFIIGRLRSGILSFITGRLCSCPLICVIGSVTAFTSGPSSICGKKKFKFF